MALELSDGYIAPSSLRNADATSLPIFNVERVQLQFSISSNFVAAQVANNVLVLALSTSRILRIDLDSPADIDDIDLPKKAQEVGVIKRMFLDPTASHLIISTALGENYYLHTQSRQPKSLSRLRGIIIDSVAWNPSQPTASTREILLGAADGSIYETYIDPSTEFYRREEKYLKVVYKIREASITGIWVEIVGKPDHRRVLVSTPKCLFHFYGRIGKHTHEGSGSVFVDLFSSEAPRVHEEDTISNTAPSTLAISPNPIDDGMEQVKDEQRIFAWLSEQGILYGKLLSQPVSPDLGSKLFAESKFLPRTGFPISESYGVRQGFKPICSMVLSQWHILALVEDRLVAINRLDQSVVLNQVVIESGQTPLGLVADATKHTYWLFTSKNIVEIVVNDEGREIWRIMLKSERFEEASLYAKTSAQKDAIATASGDYLVGKKQYMEAAAVYGCSTKSFEQVALTFIDEEQHDPLRKYLLTKLTSLKKSAVMQRTMVATWLVEIYMSKLNDLEDSLSTQAEINQAQKKVMTEENLSLVQREFQKFLSSHRSDLDRKTVYEVISSHGREEELLYFAVAVDDYHFVLSYWVQRDRWSEALDVLKRQQDPGVFYKYSSVLMAHAPLEFIDILMRQSNLDARKLVPAFLNYNKISNVSLNQNQAVRYLLFEINQKQSEDVSVHNTLISIYASAPTMDESALLSYLESQSYAGQRRQYYDADFALRLCIQHKRIRSCVHIYSSQTQYLRAVELALQHEEIDLAASVADKPDIASNPGLRKKLWLAIAREVIGKSSGGIKTAIDFLKRCELLRIEDLIPFFPDFVVIDDFKEEICNALEDYSRHIDMLRLEMDESAETAAHVKEDIKGLDKRYAIVEPGEKCCSCFLPLLSRQFFIFPCQHGFHGDCLRKKAVELGTAPKSRRIKSLQNEVDKGILRGEKMQRIVRELDNLVAAACVLCSDIAIKQIDKPFILSTDKRDEWAL